MCKERIQLGIIKKSDITKKRKIKGPACSPYIDIRTRNVLFLGVVLFTWPYETPP